MTDIFDKSTKILVSSKMGIPFPKESMGKYVFKHLQKGLKETAIVNVHTGESLTYEEILKFSIILSENFKKNGIKHNDVVAIISGNSVYFPVSLFATLFAGATAHLMCPNYTEYELASILNISKPKCILCPAKNLATLLKLREEMSFVARIISFDNTMEEVVTFEELLQTEVDIENFEPEEVNFQDVAYILNSSGTTGTSKCVTLTHQNAVSSAFLINRQPYTDLKGGDALLLPIPCFHIFGFTYLLFSLLATSKCVFMEKFIPELFLKAIEKYRISHLICPPALIKFLGQSSLVELYDLSSLTDILSGAAPLSHDALKNLKERLINAQIRQGFGMTEGGLFTVIPKGVTRPKSCGILIPNMMAKICNPETSELLGPNEAGELYLKGCNIMRGYLENPRATKESFDEDGFYRTGDLAYYDEDGYFYITDRLKEIIKYKGFQVSPIELESIIMLHPAVRDAGVVGVLNERAGELAMAYVVLDEELEAEVSEEAISQFVAERINPEKWLYGGVKFIKKLPKTASGKTSRKELRDMAKQLV